MNAWRRTFGVTTRQCLRTAGPATLAAAIVAAVAGELTAPVLADEAATGAQATLWLALPHAGAPSIHICCSQYHVRRVRD